MIFELIFLSFTVANALLTAGIGKLVFVSVFVLMLVLWDILKRLSYERSVETSV